MVEFEKEVERLNIRGIILTAILTALSLIIALIWRDAIMATIEHIKPTGEGLLYTYLSAIFVTVFVVVLAWILIKINKKLEKAKDIIKKQKLKI